MFPTERHKPFFTPPQELKARSKKFQEILSQKGAGVALLENTTALYYFTGSIQNGSLLIPAKGKPIFFVKKSLRRASQETQVETRPYPGGKGLVEEARKYLKEGAKLGLNLDALTASAYLKQSAMFEGVEIANIGGDIRKLRAIKSEWEISWIRKGSEISGQAFKLLATLARPGGIELELSAALESFLRLSGSAGFVRANDANFELAGPAVVSGGASCYGTRSNGPVGSEGLYHSTGTGASRRVIGMGETVMADIALSVNGYHSDNARTVFVGEKPPQKVLDAHRFCLECLSLLEEKMKPGASCSEIYESVAEWAKRQGEPEGFMGYGENRVKFFGHGVGLELDELPVIAKGFDMELKPGMVIAVEPKAFLPQYGPTGTENTYLITESGCESLCPALSELISSAAR